jgi:CRISPR system Cascade subunit CasC
MFVELHILQNFVPTNLNRDDTGAPKDCEFGGYRRARISSQALKRAARDLFSCNGLLPPDNLATRTRLLVTEAAKRLGAQGRPKDQAELVVNKAITGLGLKVGDDQHTQYLLFLGESEINHLVQVCLEHWDALAAVEAPSEAAGQARGRQARQAAKAPIPPEVQKALGPILDGKRTADIALFGRMLADLPDKNRDAACQVAHALSTNKVSMEFDFYTAVDDLLPKDETGAGMMGTQEFTSACFYRYANVDCVQLLENLGNDEALARKTLDAFLRAFVQAIPTSKVHSNAHQNPPSLVFTVLRDAGLWSLANAFLKPVAPGEAGGDLMAASVARLDSYWGNLTRMYGEKGIRQRCLVPLDGNGSLTNLKNDCVASLEDLFQCTLAAVEFACLAE